MGELDVMNQQDPAALIAEIRRELAWLEESVRIFSELTANTNDAEALARAAVRLHDFYMGCERIFQLIAATVNGGAILGFDWHNRLLDHAAREVENIRPPVISTPTYERLGELLHFRQVVNNIYGYMIDPCRVHELALLTVELYPRLVAEIERFHRFLLRFPHPTRKAEQ